MRRSRCGRFVCRRWLHIAQSPVFHNTIEGLFRTTKADNRCLLTRSSMSGFGDLLSANLLFRSIHGGGSLVKHRLGLLYSHIPRVLFLILPIPTQWIFLGQIKFSLIPSRPLMLNSTGWLLVDVYLVGRLSMLVHSTNSFR